MIYPLAVKSRHLIQLLILSAITLILLVLTITFNNVGSLANRVCSLSMGDSLHAKICSGKYSDKADYKSDSKMSSLLGPSSATYVVSLARRTDRRSRMEMLRNILRVKWTYVDALDKQDQIVDNVMNFVKGQRATVNATFAWPKESDESTTQAESLFGNVASKDWANNGTNGGPGDSEALLLCATGDNIVPVYLSSSVIPFHMVLSRGMIACWYSHLRLLWHIVNETKDVGEDSWDGIRGTAIVFEDDIDVEVDLADRIAESWRDLPRYWDLVMLGHCWSNEATNPPLSPLSPLHPSYKPKCTHGYVVSPFGARKLLRYLTYPPFAFSRALDQAIAHLIQSQRIRSFSVVPSVVIQRRCPLNKDCKEQDSDIWVSEGHRGSKWKDGLVSSALGMMPKEGGKTSK